MKHFLRLQNLEPNLTQTLLSTEIIESITEFRDGSNKSKAELIAEAFAGDLFTWAEDVLKFIEKSKSQVAKKLITEFDELFAEYVEELEMLEEFSELENGRLIRLLNGSIYVVSNSLEDIEEQLEVIDRNQSLGI